MCPILAFRGIGRNFYASDSFRRVCSWNLNGISNEREGIKIVIKIETETTRIVLDSDAKSTIPARTKFAKGPRILSDAASLASLGVNLARCTCMRRYARLGRTVHEHKRENRTGGKASHATDIFPFLLAVAANRRSHACAAYSESLGTKPYSNR